MTEEQYLKETAYLQASIEFKENFELEEEFTKRKPARIKVVHPEPIKNYDTTFNRISFKGAIQE